MIDTMQVKFKKVGTRTESLTVRIGATIEEVIAAAKTQLGEHLTVSQNGRPAEASDTVKPDAFVMLAPQPYNG